MKFFARHKNMYDFDILKSILGIIVISSIIWRDYLTVQTPDIEIFDSRPDGVLFVEALKL